MKKKFALDGGERSTEVSSLNQKGGGKGEDINLRKEWRPRSLDSSERNFSAPEKKLILSLTRIGEINYPEKGGELRCKRGEAKKSAEKGTTCLHSFLQKRGSRASKTKKYWWDKASQCHAWGKKKKASEKRACNCCRGKTDA